MTRIAISGANGFIGRSLFRELKSSGYEVIAINRSALYDLPKLTELISGCDLVINLAGAPILCRWTISKKREILRSRVESTSNLVEAINNLRPESGPHTFISASAIGIYANGIRHSEDSLSFNQGFLGEVVKHGKPSSQELEKSVRRVIFRIGLVLGKESKIIKQLVPLFKIGLGGKINNGQQPFPFIHINDLVQGFIWAIQNQHAEGVYNLVAPQNITNLQFTKALSNAVKLPAFFTVPEFALKIIYGEASSILTQSPIVEPLRLLRSGYQFKYSDIESSLTEILEE